MYGTAHMERFIKNHHKQDSDYFIIFVRWVRELVRRAYRNVILYRNMVQIVHQCQGKNMNLICIYFNLNIFVTDEIGVAVLPVISIADHVGALLRCFYYSYEVLNSILVCAVTSRSIGNVTDRNCPVSNWLILVGYNYQYCLILGCNH